jgi:hypothetical protein
MSGHDYVAGWEGVVRAVDEAVLDRSKLYIFSHGVWAINNQFIIK